MSLLSFIYVKRAIEKKQECNHGILFKNIVCMFTLSNDSIRVDVIPNSRGRKLSHDIPREKRMRRYPAVLIGRLGINVDFRHQGIGSELLDFIKSWFMHTRLMYYDLKKLTSNS